MKANPVVPGMTTSTGGSVTKRMESESEVKVGFDPNGNFMMMIVIDSRRSRRVIILAISSVAARWPIPENGMKISSVFSMIPDQWSLETRDRNLLHPDSREDFQQSSEARS